MRLNSLTSFKINKDIVLAVSIILLPFLFYLYSFAPKTTVWENAIFTIDSGAFEDVNYYLWFLSVKLLTLFMLTLWYISCTNIWKHLLLMPIILEIHKFLSLIKSSELGYVSEDISFFSTIYYATLYLFIIFLISKNLGYYKLSNTIPLNNEINNQMIKVSKFDIKDYKSVKSELKELEAKKLNMTKKEYLAKLIALRDQLTIIS